MCRYKYRRVNGVLMTAHALAWQEATGKPVPPGYVLHHKNGNSQDNSIENLQLMTRGEHVALHSRLRRLGLDVVDPTNPGVIDTRDINRRSYAKHCEERKRKQREYTAEHRDERIAAAKRYREENSETLKERNRDYYVRNRESRKASAARYRAERKDLIHAKELLRSAIRSRLSDDVIAERRKQVEIETKKFESNKKA